MANQLQIELDEENSKDKQILKFIDAASQVNDEYFHNF